MPSAPNPFDLSGKTCLVTGGNRGIGLGMAQALIAAGAHCIIWGSSAKNNAAALKHLRANAKDRVSAQKVNVADETEVMDAFAALMEEHQKIDAVFANAGIGQFAGTFAEMDTQAWRNVLAVNLDGAFFTLRAAAKAMIAQGRGGSLVAVASLAAIEGAARNEHYAASKGGLVSMMNAIAVEHGRWHIRANTILPGWIATDMTDALRNNESFQGKVLPRIPIRRWGEPTDFGGVAVYLASDASAYHSGDTFIIDGAYRLF
ncbi:MAG: SDR family NAD(P)-dependent oxidoreductase [Hyphomicrobiales bacterium]|nr:SDR family NAD(P)-dependent oxidoreductase [Hyphomicrobiales bacterium]